MYKYYFYNANSHNNFIDDCFPRAYSVVMDKTWKKAKRGQSIEEILKLVY